MNRKPYSAGAVKFSFWFIEFRKTVQLLAEGKSFSDIKLLNEQEKPDLVIGMFHAGQDAQLMGGKYRENSVLRPKAKDVRLLYQKYGSYHA